MIFVFAGLILAAVFLLPIVMSAVVYARTGRLRVELERLRERVRELEAGSARAPSSSGPPPAPRPSEPAPRPAEPTPPVEPAPRLTGPLPSRPEPEPLRPTTAAAPVAAMAAASSSSSPDEESLESRIGGRWFLNIAIVLIVIGVAYFEKLAIENRWIGETARVIQGGVLGAVLIYAGTRFARAGYRLYGQMICGGGVAVLYVSTYAAFNYYRLIDRPVAFALLVGITALGAFLADRQRSQGLAVLAVGGGFVTPFLLPSNVDAQIALFTYDAILIAGTVYLARRRDWPILNLVSYVFTLVTVAGWADRYYGASKYLRTELFLTLYCAMFVVIARWCRKAANDAARLATYFLWTAPVAYYLASLVVLQGHPVALLVWLIGLTLTAAFLASAVRPAAGLVAWLAAALPLLAWTQIYGGPAWLTPGLWTITAVYVIALAAQVRIMTDDGSFGAVEIAWLHLNGLLMFAAAYFLLERTHLAVTGPAAAAFAAWHGVLAGVLLGRHRDRALHFAALAFTLLSIAVALQFDGPAVTVGWAAEGAAVIALGLHERRDWLRTGGALLFLVAIVRTVELLGTVAPANHVVLLNPRAASAIVIVALAYLIAWLHRRHPDASNRQLATGAGIVVAQFVSVVLLTSEIRAFFAVGGSELTREVMISVTWAAYATALILIGLYKRYAPVRYFGIALFGITIVKVFAADMAHLERIYRVMSVMGLGVLLLLTSYLYQRTRGTVLGSKGGDSDAAGQDAPV